MRKGVHQTMVQLQKAWASSCARRRDSLPAILLYWLY
jgi:hypothetical protein